MMSQVTFSLLPPDEVERLRAQQLTYAAVGATASEPPPGFAFFATSRFLPHDDFDAAARDLMSWQVQQRAGLKVAASSPTVTTDAVVVMSLGPRPMALPGGPKRL
jgi:uncharacterized protein (UPF0548 family)